MVSPGNKDDERVRAKQPVVGRGLEPAYHRRHLPGGLAGRGGAHLDQDFPLGIKKQTDSALLLEDKQLSCDPVARKPGIVRIYLC